MYPRNNTVWATVVVVVLSIGILGLIGSAAYSSSVSDDISKVQQSLSDKGLYRGRIDGVMGPRTRTAIGAYQKSENLPVTKHLDAETAGKLGVGPESTGGKFKGAGQDVKEGTKEAGHDIGNGKPIEAGKEFGKGIGQAGKKVGQGIKKAVTP